MHKSPAKQRAIADGSTTYRGGPCRRCGHRVRYVCNSGCKHCQDARAARFRRYILTINLNLTRL
nr:MAG TPA: large ribosomal subunit 50S RIBOSOMAL SUBUNIT, OXAZOLIDINONE, RIBOSOME [Caudoviricetes sp.]